MSDAEQHVADGAQQIGRELDGRLAQIAGEPMGFMLFVFPVNRPGTCIRVGNIDNASTIQVLEQTLAYLRTGAAGPGRPLEAAH